MLTVTQRASELMRAMLSSDPENYRRWDNEGGVFNGREATEFCPHLIRPAAMNSAYFPCAQRSE